MGNQLLASKIVVEEEPPRVRGTPSLPTAVLGAVGVTEKGPVGQETLCLSFEDFTNTFGGYTPSGDLALAVQGFFENGGNTAHVVRVVHYTDPSNPSTKTSAKATGTIPATGAGGGNTLRADGKYDGAYANLLRVKIAAATSGEADRFNVDVLDLTGLILESFPNLSMSDTDPRFAVRVVNASDSGSTRIALTDLLSVAAAPGDRPQSGTYALAGGSDGLSGLVDADFVGSAAGATGFRAFDVVEDLTLLICPGIATPGVHNAMVTYCEVARSGQVFAILDPPAGQNASGIITYVTATAALGGLTEHAAIYWPRIKVLNPSPAIFGDTNQIVVPPSGHIAGVYARDDNARVGGIYDPPAGTEKGIIFGALGFETKDVLKEAVRDLVFPKRINPITTLTGFPRFIDGSRVLKGDGNFPFVAQRRGASFIERSVSLSLQFVRHAPNDQALRAGARRTVFAFLKAQMDAGAFRSREPDTAFFVDFGDALNPPSKGNIVTGRIGLAMNDPAEFVVLKFSKDTRALEAELAG